MKDYQNYKWSMEDVAHQYKIENPEWAWSRCWDMAKLVHRELKKLNDEMWRDTKTFFDQTTPFSFFDNKDDEFSNVFWDGN